MSNPSRDSGNREERAIVNKFKDVPGWTARRVPLSGAAEGFKGDVIAVAPTGHEFRLESKVRKPSDSTSGIKTLTGWLGRNDMLWMRLKGDRAVVVIPEDVFWEIIEHWKTDAESVAARAAGERG